jgi:hypothetical protein
MGGQVIAHRIRMMKQNWNIIWIIGRVCFLLSFIFGSMMRWKMQDIWNYLCILKAVWRDGMTTLPSSLFSSSVLWFQDGTTKWVSDHWIATHKGFLAAKEFFEAGLFSRLLKKKSERSLLTQSVLLSIVILILKEIFC